MKIQALFLILLANSIFGDYKKSATKKVYLYRVINWCIIGRGEPELYEWPFVQFRPLLLTDHKVRQYDDNFRDKDDKLNYGIYGEKAPNFTISFNAIKCGNNDKNDSSSEIGFHGAYNQRAHVVFKSTVLLEGLVIQAVHSPFGMGFPFGQFSHDSEFSCTDCKNTFSIEIGCISRPDSEFMHPTVAVYHHRYKKPGTKDEVGKKKELHVNYKWDDSPCSSARIVEFWVMAVISFNERIWMTQKFGPYDFETAYAKRKVELTEGNIAYQPSIPSPIMPSCVTRTKTPPQPLPKICVKDITFENCVDREEEWHDVQKEVPGNITCEGDPYEFRPSADPFTSTASKEVYDRSDSWSNVRFSGDFDVRCISKYNTRLLPHKVCPTWAGKFACVGSADFKYNDPEQRKGSPEKKRLFPFSYCDPCITPKPTPKPADVNTDPGFFKRGVHSTLMIIAFFFLLPINCFIARFYKETLHFREYKGWRLWLLIHVIASIVIQVLCYASYTISSASRFDRHMFYGYCACFACVGGFITGWTRHKNNCMNWVLIAFHLSFGYAAYVFAITSFVVHGKIQTNTRIAAYVSCVVSGLAILVLSVHIYVEDKKMGMIPNRSHIPTVRIRFDDVFPPGHKARIVILGVYIFLLFIVCFAMMTLPEKRKVLP